MRAQKSQKVFCLNEHVFVFFDYEKVLLEKPSKLKKHWQILTDEKKRISSLCAFIHFMCKWE